MVNTITMNIDVREYLRINPISVHPLTLSSLETDCFLYFNDGGQTYEDGKTYTVYTQKQVFNGILSTIFQNWVEIDGDGNIRFKYTIDEHGKIHWEDIPIKDNQFREYARRKNWEHLSNGIGWYQYKSGYTDDSGNIVEGFDGKLLTLEQNIDALLEELRNQNATLDYSGAVELQSCLIHELRNLKEDPYKDFSYSLDFIWCYQNGINPNEGYDEVILSTPLFHKHNDTMAETLTEPITKNSGGSTLVGDFTIGNKQIVSQNAFPISSFTTSMITNPTVEEITYPLYGENVIDWRYAKKSHNNLPPYSNIYIRYNQRIVNKTVKTIRSVENISNDKEQKETSVDSKKTSSIIEAQYESKEVNELDSYQKEDLTDHDYLLRLSLDEKEEPQLAKQSLKHFLSIFVDVANRSLNRYFDVGGKRIKVSMSEAIYDKLNKELVPTNEFMKWYYDIQRRFSVIDGKLEEIQELLNSVKPRTYVGRIIISTTDDIEAKVIEHYGGTKWRRIINFLRGVTPDSTGSELDVGGKGGESCVCLRESNVPVHTHNVTLQINTTDEKDESPTWSELQKYERLRAFPGGTEMKIVNEKPSSENSSLIEKTNGVKDSDLDYQISPLEYQMEKDSVTYPHDNIPPYREVYIWECVSVTKDEEYTITYDMNGHGYRPDNAWRTYTKDSILPYSPPTALD